MWALLARRRTLKPNGIQLVRRYRVLSLESSCDDSCVALLDKHLPGKPPRIIDQFKVTLDSAKDGGIIPTSAHEFHQQEFANLVHKFCQKHNLTPESAPDLICCTRGPGMIGSLSAGLQLAKGLSIGWNKPLIGVHHMLGHLLTATLPKSKQPDLLPPKYPFLSLLCSGGHTMLVLLKSLTDHEIIIDTNDLAAGDSLDKCARELGLKGNMLGKELERFVNEIPEDLKSKFSKINTTTRDNEFQFQLKLPLRTPKIGKFPDNVEFSFTPFLSSIKQLRERNHEFSKTTKQFIAYKIQEVMFGHMIDRINIAFKKHGLDTGKYEFADGKFNGVKDFVCSGGVAANSRLREKLFTDLSFETNLLIEKQDMTFHFPDLQLCTDNAIMIGVAGIEILESLKIKSSYKVLPIRKWPINELLEVDGWLKMDDEEFAKILH